MAHTFDESLERGEKGETILDQYFSKWFTITPASRDEQRKGIDRWFERLEDSIEGKKGERFAVEFKTDYRANTTGNAFIEVVSVDTAEKQGWAYTSQAAYLLYFLPDADLCYWLEMTALRRRLRAWATIYPRRPVQNEEYQTWGLLVPLHEFEKAAKRKVRLGGYSSDNS